MPRPKNLLIIMMDELSRDGLGCYGGPAITPNIDALAGRGVQFTDAYTPSPICVPARASFQTGRYAFQNRCWSNAQPYHGQTPGWAHHLRDAGWQTTSIGKLHYRSAEDDNGYGEEIVPLHVKDGIGWVHGLLRREDHTCFSTAGYVRDVGVGNDGYSDYDRTVRDRTVAWLQEEREEPWATFVSFLRPHYPLTCPQEWLDLYDPEALPPIRDAGRKVEFRHPVLNSFRSYNDFDDHFESDEHRKLARACYFGLCSFVDDLVGDVLKALEQSGQADDTLVILTADHGDMNGHKGLWTKMVMYEDSVGIPMIIAGPSLNPGVSETPVSLIDIHATAMDLAGLEDTDAPGQSLLHLASEPDNPDRPIFSEYHDGGAITGYSMLRSGRWKYIHYAGFPPQLFDLEEDPFEENDLGLSSAHAEIRMQLLAQMINEFADPESVNAQAFTDQQELIASLGGPDGIRARANYDHTPVKAD